MFDATGREIVDDRVIWADTETGECVKLVPADEGTYEMTVDDGGKVVPSKRWVTYPAPLRLERMWA